MGDPLPDVDSVGETVPVAEKEGMGLLDEDTSDEDVGDGSDEEEEEGDAAAVRVWLIPPVTTADKLPIALRLRVGDTEVLLEGVTVVDGSGEFVLVVVTDTLLVFVTIPDEVAETLVDGLFDTAGLTLELEEIVLEAVREEIKEELELTDGDPVLEEILEDVLDTLGDRVWVGELVLDFVPTGVMVAAFERVAERVCEVDPVAVRDAV